MYPFPRIGTILTLTILIGCAVSCLAQEKAQRLSPSQAYAQALAAAKRDGFPVSAQDLQITVPPEQNAAPLYKEFRASLKSDPLSPAEAEVISRASGGNLSAAQVETLRQLLENHKKQFVLLHQAASRPHCIFPRNWAKDFLILPSESGLLREAARWLSAESAFALQNRQWAEAVRAQSLCFHVARHAAADPTLIAYLTGAAINALAFSGMETILHRTGEVPDVAEAVQKAMEEEYQPLDLAQVLQGEWALKILTLEWIRNQKPSDIKGIFGDKPTPAERAVIQSVQDKAAYNRFLDANGANLIEIGRKEVEAIKQPFRSATQHLAQMNSKIPKDQRDYMVVNYLIGMETDATLPQSPARMQARAYVVRVGAAVQAWRARHKRLPETLQEVMATVPLDPFDEKPLRYRREERNFVIYSVGPSGKFAGGAPGKRPKTSEIFFRSADF